MAGLTCALFFEMAFLSAGCAKNEGRPADLIAQDRMAEILRTIYITEAQAASHYDLDYQKDEYFKNFLYPAIFDSFQVDDSAFYRSYAWYENHPALFEVLMDSVAAGIERMPVDTSAAGTAGEEGSVEEAYQDLIKTESLRGDE